MDDIENENKRNGPKSGECQLGGRDDEDEGADMSASESGDDPLNPANISWSRIQKNLDELNNIDNDDDDDDQPSIRIDQLDDLLLGYDDSEGIEGSDSEENAQPNTDRTNRLIRQSTSIRRIASTRSSSSSSNTARQRSPIGELEQSLEQEAQKENQGRMIEPDELKLSIENDEKCAICLEEFKVEQFVREINCKHKFHIECIDTWLQTHLNCPVCRKRLSQSVENGQNYQVDDDEDNEQEDENDDLYLDIEDFDEIRVLGEIMSRVNSLAERDAFNREGDQVIQVALDPYHIISISVGSINRPTRQTETVAAAAAAEEVADEQATDTQSTLPGHEPESPRPRSSTHTSLVRKPLVQTRQIRAISKKMRRRQRLLAQTSKTRRFRSKLTRGRGHSKRATLSNITNQGRHFSNCAHLNRYRFN